MFKELFEGKVGAVNGKENKIEKYFLTKGYTISAGIFTDKNELYIGFYPEEFKDPDFETRIPYNNQTPTEIYKEIMKIKGK